MKRIILTEEPSLTEDDKPKTKKPEEEPEEETSHTTTAEPVRLSRSKFYVAEEAE